MYSIYIPGTEEHVKCKIIETDAAVVLRPVVYNQPPDNSSSTQETRRYMLLFVLGCHNVYGYIELFCVVRLYSFQRNIFSSSTAAPLQLVF